MATFAVDQHQRVGRCQAAVGQRADGRVIARDVGAVVEGWQQLGDGFGQVGAAGLEQLIAGHDVYRGRAVGDGALRATHPGGYHRDLFQAGFLFSGFIGGLSRIHQAEADERHAFDQRGAQGVADGASREGHNTVILMSI